MALDQDHFLVVGLDFGTTYYPPVEDSHSWRIDARLGTQVWHGLSRRSHMIYA